MGAARCLNPEPGVSWLRDGDACGNLPESLTRSKSKILGMAWQLLLILSKQAMNLRMGTGQIGLLPDLIYS